MIICWFLWNFSQSSMKQDQRFLIFFEFIVLLFLSIRAFFLKIQYKFRPIEFFIVIYTLCFFIANSAIQISFRDLLINNKALVYIFFLPTISFNYKIDILIYARILKWLLILFVLMYFLDAGNGLRPYVFYENNFELITLILLCLPLIFFKEKGHKQIMLLLGLLVILGGSFSAGVIFAMTLFFHLGILKGSIIALPMIIYFLVSRDYGFDNLTSIDRYQFWLIGLSEIIYNRTVFDVFLNFQLIPISEDYNSTLNFYNLYSKADLNNYPVALHSGMLRLLLTNGLVVAIIVPLIYFNRLNKIFKTKISLIIVFSIILSSFSVSGFYSFFVFLPLIFILNLFDPNLQ